MKLSDEMRRVLKRLGQSDYLTPKQCRCGYLTFAALEKRGLIRVATTFGSVAFPRTAEATITDAGRQALKTR